ncbi:MAG: hypothetical protein MJE68_30135 [Proteobacteria bacterium]|nr:hypothetical protein [Pseudomonadota bacterium]
MEQPCHSSYNNIHDLIYYTIMIRVLILNAPGPLSPLLWWPAGDPDLYLLSENYTYLAFTFRTALSSASRRRVNGIIIMRVQIIYAHA